MFYIQRITLPCSSFLKNYGSIHMHRVISKCVLYFIVVEYVTCARFHQSFLLLFTISSQIMFSCLYSHHSTTCNSMRHIGIVFRIVFKSRLVCVLDIGFEFTQHKTYIVIHWKRQKLIKVAENL